MTGKDFSERIDFCLKQRNQTRKALTQDLGIPSSTMSGWSATKQTIPRADVVEAIALYFGVSTDWLIMGKESNGVSQEDTAILYKLHGLTLANYNAVVSLLNTLYEQEQISAAEKNTAG